MTCVEPYPQSSNVTSDNTGLGETPRSAKRDKHEDAGELGKGEEGSTRNCRQSKLLCSSASENDAAGVDRTCIPENDKLYAGSTEAEDSCLVAALREQCLCKDVCRSRRLAVTDVTSYP